MFSFLVKIDRVDFAFRLLMPSEAFREETGASIEIDYFLIPNDGSDF